MQEHSFIDKPAEPMKPLVRSTTQIYPPLDFTPEEDRHAQHVDYVFLFRKYLPVALLFAVVGALIGLVAVIIEAPTYKARVLLEVHAISETFLQNSPDPLAASYDSNTVNLQTQVTLLQAGPFIQRVQQRLSSRKPAKPVQGDIFSLLRAQVGRQADDPDSTAIIAARRAAATFEVRPVNGTRLLELSCESTDPQIAADFLNEISNEFIHDAAQARTGSAQQTTQWLTAQLDETKSKLQVAETALRDFVRQSGNIFAGADSTLDDAKLKQLQGELAKAQADRITKQARYETAVKSKPEAIPEVATDIALQNLRAKLVDIRHEKAMLLATLTPEHPKVKRLEAQETELLASVAHQTNAILGRLQNEYADAARHERLLSTAYAAQGSNVAALSGKAAEYSAKKLEVDTLKIRYDSLLQRINQTGIGSSLPIEPFHLVQPASAPAAPYKPHPAANIGLGVIGGLALSVAFAFIRERFDRRVQTPGSFLHLNVPELGVIPAVDKLPDNIAGRSLLPFRKKELPQLSIAPHIKVPTGSDNFVAHAAWERGISILTESFRTTLAALIREAGDGKSSKVIMVTSPGPGDGKTTMVTNLGIAIAESGRRVVLVDADFRKPRLSKVFDIKRERGLVDLLQEDTLVNRYSVQDLATTTTIPGLSLLPSGECKSNVARLLYSPRVPMIIARLRQEFDVVLLDVPPILWLADARIVGPFTDGAALIIRAGHTDRQSILTAYQYLMSDRVPLLGTVLNSWNPRRELHKLKYPYHYSYS